MARIINEQKLYTREDLAEMVKNYAKLDIVGGWYIGDFHDQTVEWKPDGSVIVMTSHAPGSMEDWRKLNKIA